jgi:ParB-like chromosome segregation protein Spo0J
MELTVAGEVEMSAVDLRYERCRVRNVRAERELLAEISARGIDRPLAGVESGARWILIDGFKRFRCARRLNMGTVPCVSLGADEAAGILEVLKGPGWKPLGFLEEARFLQELRCAHDMSLGELAAALGRSKGWASMRLAALADMSDTVRHAAGGGGTSERERACLKDLEHLAEAMATLPGRATDSKLTSGAFRAQAHILLENILARSGEFVNAMRRFHDRCRAS